MKADLYETDASQKWTDKDIRAFERKKKRNHKYLTKILQKAVDSCIISDNDRNRVLNESTDGNRMEIIHQWLDITADINVEEKIWVLGIPYKGEHDP
jgi:hypothetical protein